MNCHQFTAVALTFLTYATYSGIRQALSVAKDPLHTMYAPFDDDSLGTLYLGILDFVYLTMYAAFQIVVVKVVGKWEINLAFLASGGLAASSVCLMLFATGGEMGVHTLSYFVIMQALHGAVQACGWISCFTITARWLHAHAHMSLILCVWNAHASVGNIIAKSLGGSVLLPKWGWEGVFYGLGAWAMVVAGFIFWLLKSEPDDDATVMDTTISPACATEQKSPTFVLVGYCLCLFFAKIVNNLFTSWLPFYLDALYNSQSATIISAMFDVGGVVGTIATGFACDYFQKSKTGTISFLCLLACAPVVGVFLVLKHAGTLANGVWMVLLGAAVNAPVNLIGSVVVADLSHQGSNARTLAISTGVVNFAGSLGSAVQGIAVGLAANRIGWDTIFHALIVISVVSALLLIPVVRREYVQGQQIPTEVEDVSTTQMC